MSLKLPFFGLLLCCSPVYAQQALLVKGQVDGERAGKKFDVVKGSALQKGDRLQTGKGSVLLLNWGEGIKIKMDPETVLILEGEPEGAPKVELKNGGIISDIFKKTASGQRFQVKTSIASMGVRGTQFYVAQKEALWMCVQNGEVEVVTSEGSVDVPAGKGVFIQEGKIPRPKKYEWTEQIHWSMDDEIHPVKMDAVYEDILEHFYD